MPNDAGPIYLETQMGRFPVEPWNTYSNLLFLALIIFWFFRVRHHAREHQFIAFSLPIFFLGYIGGTVYHATRSHEVWLILDWVPIAFLSIVVATSFWRRLQFSWFIAPLLVIGPVVLAGFAISLLGGSDMPIWWLLVVAFAILTPVLAYLVRSGWKDVGLVAGSLAGFAVAIGFRSIDLSVPIAFLPMGTHWLWHIFGAASVHLLILYIYRSDLKEAAGHVARREASRTRPASEAAR